MRVSIRHLAALMIGFFLVLIFYLSYLQVYKAEDLAAHPKNRRSQQMEAEITRGKIYDRKGEVLAATENKKRVYPGGSLAGGITGYNSLKYGKTGLEERYNKFLLGLTEDRYWENFKDRLLGKTRYGDDLHLTLDLQLQSAAAQALGNRKGAVAALNPKTGEVLVLYSNPSFDPNRIDEIWKEVSGQGKDSPLINRAIWGLYPPGSTMKVLTGALALRKDPGIENRQFEANGSILVDGFRLRDHSAFGWIGFYKALAVSSNVVFAQLGLDIGKDSFYQGAKDFGFDRQLPFDLPVATSTLAAPNQMTKTELASSAIGQGKVLATPLQMALVTSAIANEGNIMFPRLVSRITSHNGDLVKKTDPSVLYKPISSDVAQIMKKAMVGVVEGSDGTGSAARIPGIQVAGKTGSAENALGRETHAWFVGFAPADNPKIVVAVIVENSGYGGVNAAPIVRAIMEKALQ